MQISACQEMANTIQDNAVTITEQKDKIEGIKQTQLLPLLHNISTQVIIYGNIKQVASYARCDWSVTVFISGYANTVVTSQHVSQSWFIKEIENGRPVFI